MTELAAHGSEILWEDGEFVLSRAVWTGSHYQSSPTCPKPIRRRPELLRGCNTLSSFGTSSILLGPRGPSGSRLTRGGLRC